jgi:putative membrane protein
MLRDFLLASLHHLLAFGLVAMLAAESLLLSRPLDRAALQRLSRIDLGYGLVAVTLLAVGLSRVFFGLKGAGFYLHNPWFHAKLGAFLLAGLVSIAPTLAFVRWRRALRADPAWLPGPGQAARARILIRVQLALVAVILVCAAAVPRHGGLFL